MFEGPFLLGGGMVLDVMSTVVGGGVVDLWALWFVRHDRFLAVESGQGDRIGYGLCSWENTEAGRPRE
jgi:hypothetical protein